MKTVLAALGLAATVTVVHAQGAADMLRSLEQTASKEQAGFAGFSAARGQAFFAQRHGQEWSCTSCHTTDPRAVGRHAVTGKPIEPLAPSANSARFSNPAKVDKWFRRNCKDVVARECTAAEKGDVITYLASLAS